MDKTTFDDLGGKVCVITGGGGLIGTSLARGLASVGVRIALLDVKQELVLDAARQLKAQFGIDVLGVEGNVLDKQSLMDAKHLINKDLGKIDFLINCAGGNSPKATTQTEFVEKGQLGELDKSFYGLDIEGFRNVFDLNFLGTILPTMVLTIDMVQQGKGSVINISSMNSFRPLTKIPAYSAAKASVNNFTQWLAVHLAKVNVRVNAIAPGFFLTNQNRFLLLDAKTGELTERGKKILSSTPVGKFGQPEDLQGATLFFLSDVSRFVTGVVLPVDGGFSAFSGV